MLFLFATSQTHFLFSGKFYNQIDGVAMNVDDILAAFDKEQDSLNFLKFLNKKHPNIKFTIEKQVNHYLVFLDVFISGINSQNLALQTYHKSTYTGLLLSFKSFLSFSFKISLIICLIDTHPATRRRSDVVTTSLCTSQ